MPSDAMRVWREAHAAYVEGADTAEAKLLRAIFGDEEAKQAAAAVIERAIAEAVAQERARFRDLLENAEGIFANCSVEAGVCCCGDDMKNHSSPMLCGHSPVDLGEYQVDQWLNSYAALKRGDHKERADG